MGIIVVSFLVAVIAATLLFVGTAAILAVSLSEFWENPIDILQTVGQMDPGTARLHVTLLVVTIVLLLVFACADFVVHVVRNGNYKRKDLLEIIFVIGYYVTFLVFLGNGLFYIYDLFIKFNTLF